MLSTMGIRKLRPGSRMRLNFPNLSTTHAWKFLLGTLTYVLESEWLILLAQEQTSLQSWLVHSLCISLASSSATTTSSWFALTIDLLLVCSWIFDEHIWLHSEKITDLGIQQIQHIFFSCRAMRHFLRIIITSYKKTQDTVALKKNLPFQLGIEPCLSSTP